MLSSLLINPFRNATPADWTRLRSEDEEWFCRMEKVPFSDGKNTLFDTHLPSWDPRDLALVNGIIDGMSLDMRTLSRIITTLIRLLSAIKRRGLRDYILPGLNHLN